MTCSNSSKDTTEGFHHMCSSLNYSCGSLKNLGYPFWGDDRPEFCGAKQEFKINCWKNGTDPRINRMLKVLNVDQSSNTLQVRLDPHTCGVIDNSSTWNLTSSYKLGASVRNLILFPNCSRSFKPKQCVKISCYENELPGHRSYCNFDNKSCKGGIEVPVLKRALHQLNQGKSTLDSLLKEGFELEYTVPNLSDCKECRKTGGTCGSSGKPSWIFKCYHPDRKKNPRWLILGLGIAVGTIIILTLAYGWYCEKCKSHSRSISINGSLDHMTSNCEEGHIYFHVPLFSYTELEEATSKFDASKELGSGGFGRVYYGKVRDGREVAVKRLYENSYRRVDQFMNEVKILTGLRHQHLVSLYGCTPLNSRELFLVYEYVPNGTVADHLFGNKSQTGLLHWHIRMKIALETAIALSYLHLSDIIHRDVKTNNILLDNNFSVKVADFGLS